MPFNLFRKKKQPEPETPAVPSQEEPQQAAPAQPQEQPMPEPAVPAEAPIIAEEPAQEPAASLPVEEPQPQETPAPAQMPPQEPPVTPLPPVESKPEVPAESASKTYLKAMPLKELADIEKVKTEVKNGNIIILRITPLASKSIEDVKNAVNELFQFAESTGGDIARLGEERVVICPKSIRIWREKTPAPVTSSREPLPTAA